MNGAPMYGPMTRNTDNRLSPTRFALLRIIFSALPIFAPFIHQVHPVIDKLIPSALRSRAISFDKSFGTPYTDRYTFDLLNIDKKYIRNRYCYV